MKTHINNRAIAFLISENGKEKEKGSKRGQSRLFKHGCHVSHGLAQSLLNAHKRGVKVQLVLDSSQRAEKYSSADFIRNAGIPCLIDGAHAIAHNKVMVIDGQPILELATLGKGR